MSIGADDHPSVNPAGRRRLAPACLEGALELLRCGLPPVVLHAPGDLLRRRDGTLGRASGKEPRFPDWPRRARQADEASLRRDYEEHPDSGVGVLLGLGPGGEPGVFDLEVDDPQAAAPALARAFGAAGPPDTLRFTSNKGQHRLYALDAATAARLRRLGIAEGVVKGERSPEGIVRGDPAYVGLEIRIGTIDPARPVALQSACPPTPRADGSPRRWEGSAIAPFPEALLADLAAHSRAARELAARGRRREPPPRPEGRDLTPIELFLRQLRGMRLRVEPSGDGYACQCPVHHDRTPSMAFREGDRGELLAYCHGCNAPFEAIMRAVGLTVADAYPAGQGLRRPTPCRARRDLGLDGTPREVDDATAEYFAHRLAEGIAALAERPEKLRALSARLGVSEASLAALDVGWREDWEKDNAGAWVPTGRWAWVFPERDGRGRVVGLLRRYEDESLEKKLVGGGRRGLIVPRDWRTRPGPVILTEGASDAAAVLDLGRCAIGRPQAKSRAVLADLVALLGEDPRAVLVAADGDVVGRAGAEALARGLGRALEREVRVLPTLPSGVKDLRQLLTSSLGEGVDHVDR